MAAGDRPVTGPLIVYGVVFGGILIGLIAKGKVEHRKDRAP